MADSALVSLLRRDRMIVAASLATLTAISWIYILWLAATMDMGGMAVPGTDIGMGTNMGMGADMHMPAETGRSLGTDQQAGGLASVLGLEPRPWSAVEAGVMATMWIVMMVGMMLPSATPMILLYAHVGRHSLRQGKPFAATGFFAGGYLLAWTGFALAATLGQWLLEGTLLSPALASASRVFSGIVLVVVGLYQWTPLKDACLSHCQAPIVFIQTHGGFRRDPRGAVALGFRHGLYCVGCCWALMALLFVGGIMNVLWIAAIAGLVLVEKLVRAGRVLPRAAGAVLIAAGLWQLLPGTL
ncbi:DUF2182 domain-containing protein [Sinorhizobium alkalisoli]|uniref:DUF2182 domain-containing protein n=1 Tax=Sinorhizobium alkalisoli TaxID=1752398 RepID=UPI00124CFE65|nr:DUF2182 domain-containing protein [Sinorhizobium alkalisoli]MCA1490164.1 DUF2182 domain-containing protein [Ensifer sp. NBAIM29]